MRTREVWTFFVTETPTCMNQKPKTQSTNPQPKAKNTQIQSQVIQAHEVNVDQDGYL